jgi:dihydropteroate synthase
MGVVNVTPDSFSDGGLFFDHDAAIAHARALVADGADIVDVGGESTRPGAAPVAEADELARVVPVVRRLASEPGVVVSIDTTKSGVAAAALDAGATIVNDVTAGNGDPAMLATVAAAGAGFVAMHMQGEPRTMQADPAYHDVVAEVGQFLGARVGAARAAGIRADRIWADPGIGFGKTVAHNLALLAHLPDLAAVAGAPLVVGTSRKSFLGTLLDGAAVDERDDATLATVVWSFDHGAAMVRVHDVRSAVRAARLLEAMRSARAEVGAA